MRSSIPAKLRNDCAWSRWSSLSIVTSSSAEGDSGVTAPGVSLAGGAFSSMAVVGWAVGATTSSCNSAISVRSVRLPLLWEMKAKVLKELTPFKEGHEDVLNYMMDMIEFLAERDFKMLKGFKVFKQRANFYVTETIILEVGLLFNCQPPVRNFEKFTTRVSY